MCWLHSSTLCTSDLNPWAEDGRLLSAGLRKLSAASRLDVYFLGGGWTLILSAAGRLSHEISFSATFFRYISRSVLGMLSYWCIIRVQFLSQTWRNRVKYIHDNFPLHNLREFMQMTSYHEFDDKPLANSVHDECIFCIVEMISTILGTATEVPHDCVNTPLQVIPCARWISCNGRSCRSQQIDCAYVSSWERRRCNCSSLPSSLSTLLWKFHSRFLRE